MTISKAIKGILMISASLASTYAFAGVVCNGVHEDPEANCGPPATRCGATTCNYYNTYIKPKAINAPTQSTVTNAVAASQATLPNYGSTPAQIHANFVANLVGIIATNPTINQQWATWPDAQISGLAGAVYTYSNKQPGVFFTQIAKTLTAKNLQKVRQAFGPMLDAYVAASSPAAVSSAYFTIPAPTSPLPGSPYEVAALYGPETWSPVLSPTMDITDLFDLFMAREGATFASASIELSMYSGVYLNAAWWTGYHVGSGMLAAMTALFPTQDIAYNTLESMLGSIGINLTPIYNPNSTPPTVGQPAVQTFPLPPPPVNTIIPLDGYMYCTPEAFDSVSGQCPI